MQLTGLFVLASAALGAVAQYDDALYDDVQYYTENRPVATVYGGGKSQDIQDHRCHVLQSPVGGQVNSIEVRQPHYCQLFLDNNCNREWIAGTYFYQGSRRQPVHGKATQAHTIRCVPGRG
ncbi:hypothetical protein H634G_10917 [Metarhizium anisopliae BRIP 53293]|uniref:Uncharacterized protein n=1 Tax=Metarhizium anisopliae BRIP 53293 TaxID=1291518 RepID=A0A0D9NMH2_METAN|nr:hypothetical protein H634G_10917 [Metarhizium anisopliae BRIP 53293]KJK86179.1 hypothetical protein H633G_09976 [Metarhizium anisopliae BRIP 53284]